MQRRRARKRSLLCAGKNSKEKRRGRRDSTSWLSERTNFHPNSLFIRFISEQMMYIIHGPLLLSVHDTWLTWRSNTSVPGPIPGRGQVSTCLFTADKKREFLRHFHYELTSLLLLFLLPFFFYCFLVKTRTRIFEKWRNCFPWFSNSKKTFTSCFLALRGKSLASLSFCLSLPASTTDELSAAPNLHWNFLLILEKIVF